MSNRDPRQRFDYQNWLNGQVAERAKASLTARDAAFAENNAGVTRAALTQYLNVCAAALGHSPSPTEIDGGAFIEQRFGSWDNAMTAAGLPRPKTTPKLNNTLRYRMEKEKLLPLFLSERKEKKRQKQIEKNLRQGRHRVHGGKPPEPPHASPEPPAPEHRPPAPEHRRPPRREYPEGRPDRVYKERSGRPPRDKRPAKKEAPGARYENARPVKKGKGSRKTTGR